MSWKVDLGSGIIALAFQLLNRALAKFGMKQLLPHLKVLPCNWILLRHNWQCKPPIVTSHEGTRGAV